jgi:3-oxoacyl-[acyl-carrier-protein] synthase III
MINKLVSAKMAGIGAYVPETVLNNAYFEKIVDTSDEWIVTRTGIKERHVVGDSGQCTSDMSIKAARQALADAQMSPEELDMIIIGTVTPDMKTPSTACFVQKALGAKNAAVMDVNAACVGYLYALTTARAYILAGMARTVLVVGCETLTSITNYKDRGTCILFGDGAGAAVLKRVDEPGVGVLATHLAANGDFTDLLCVKLGGSRTPLTPENIHDDGRNLYMNGSEIFKHAVRFMQSAAEKVIADAGVKAEDISLFIPHQANIRIIDSLAKRLSIPEEKLFVNIQNYGNTSSASIPIAMVEARQQGRLKTGDLALLVSFGGGLVWGAALVRF